MDELLLDSTYLLPLFGLKVDLKDFVTGFPLLLDAYSVTYHPLALVEGKRVILKLSRKYPSKKKLLLEAYRKGLRTIQGEKKLKQTVLTNQTIEEVADRLLDVDGVRDYFDRMTYGTAAYNNVLLLTEDEELLKVSKTDRSPRPRKVGNWEKMLLGLR